MVSLRLAFRLCILITNSATSACLITSHLHLSSRRWRYDSSRASSVSDEAEVLRIEKSPESSFWRATPQQSSDSSTIPAVDGLDRETGPLPPGAYRIIASETGSQSNICLVSMKIRPPMSPKQGDDIWKEGVKNCQKMIDSGFNSFSMGNAHGDEILKRYDQVDKTRLTKKAIEAAKKMQEQYTARGLQRHHYETEFYAKLRQETPSSVLRTCHFAVDMEIPSIFHVSDPILDKNKPAPTVAYGNGWAVRKSISDALLRVKTDCLDAVNLEYKPNSAYHLDVLNTLFEMQVEGLIKTISVKNFPPSLLQSAFDCGFHIYATEFYGSLINTQTYSQSDSRLMGMDACKRLISGPLAGGLLTQSYSAKGDIRQLTSSEKKLFDLCCKCVGSDRTEKWTKYREVMNTLTGISFKHRVSVGSVALRWLLELNENNLISVGTKLGMDLQEEKGGSPYRRQSELRQVFSFAIDEEDLERLNTAADISKHASPKNPLGKNFGGDFIDFNDKSLWL